MSTPEAGVPWKIVGTDQHVLGTVAPLFTLNNPHCSLPVLSPGSGVGLGRVGNSHGCLPGPPRNSVGGGSGVGVRMRHLLSAPQ